MSRWDCSHESSEMRTMRIAGGGIQYRLQCLICGRAASNAVPAATLSELPPPWDLELNVRWEQGVRDSIAQSQSAAERARSQQYDAYLASTAWQDRRQAVLRRDRWVCQGCMAERACDVHHLTYSHFGNELLFQLVSLCRRCHDAAHGAEERRVA